MLAADKCLSKAFDNIQQVKLQSTSKQSAVSELMRSLAHCRRDDSSILRFDARLDVGTKRDLVLHAHCYCMAKTCDRIVLH